MTLYLLQDSHKARAAKSKTIFLDFKKKTTKNKTDWFEPILRQFEIVLTEMAE